MKTNKYDISSSCQESILKQPRSCGKMKIEKVQVTTFKDRMGFVSKNIVLLLRGRTLFEVSLQNDHVIMGLNKIANF